MRFAFILLSAFALISCKQQEDAVIINWENGKAISVSFKRSLVASGVAHIRVSGGEYDVAGKADTGSDMIRFTPDIPFERGLTYDVISDSRKVHSFSIPLDDTTKPPEVVQSYPSCDTIPENLLKMYLVFNQPMMEGRAYHFIHLVNKTTNDTVHGAFLDLQPELWSEDQLTLTLWLDPGRIKKDLIPNKTLGAVLTSNNQYELIVSPGWKSKSGRALDVGHRRDFFTKQRDSRKPDVATWKLTIGDVVTVDLNESLDQQLLTSAISLWRVNDRLEATIITTGCERSISIKPTTPFTPGTYRIEVESRLEDLAGNNLNRLFETDVTNPKSVSENKIVHTIGFTIQ